jgi:hypothetical protein
MQQKAKEEHRFIFYEINSLIRFYLKIIKNKNGGSDDFFYNGIKAQFHSGVVFSK